jgi:hypothetical protein
MEEEDERKKKENENIKGIIVIFPGEAVLI